MARLTEKDEGKDVISATGSKIGMITGVKGDVAYVDPHPGITDRIRSKLGWDTVADDDYVLEQDTIEDISDSEVRLRE